MFTSAEKLYQFVALKWEGGKGGEMETETDVKMEKTFQSPWTPCRTCSQQVAYSQTDHHACMIKVRFAGGAKNKFTAFPQRNQTRISFMVSWEKLRGWNFLPFNCSSRAFGEVSYARFFDSAIFSQLKGVLDAFRTYVCAKTSAAIARLDAHIS